MWLTVLTDATIYRTLAKVVYWSFVGCVLALVAIYMANMMINGNRTDRCKAEKGMMIKLDNQNYCVKSKYKLTHVG